MKKREIERQQRQLNEALQLLIALFLGVGDRDRLLIRGIRLAQRAGAWPKGNDGIPALHD
jgi:hypothetical protein